MPYLAKLLAVLDHWAEWARMRSAPARIDELEKRLRAIETRLEAVAESPPVPGCPSCGTAEMRLAGESSFGPGVVTKARLRVRHFACSNEDCGHEFTEQVPLENESSRRIRRRSHAPALPSAPSEDTTAPGAGDIGKVNKVKADIAAGRDELVPADVANRLVKGDSPVRVWREHRSMSVRDLATAAGLSAPYISEIETGKKKGSNSTMKKIANALKVDLDEPRR
jgi:ribosome-binding protein aMBF1 (putative translation factor)